MQFAKIIYQSERLFFRIITKVIPTCDLQFAIAKREAVVSHFIDPHQTAELNLAQRSNVLVHGPAWITINKD